MKYCSNCGKELADIASICPSCGTSQVNYAVEQARLEQENNELRKKIRHQNNSPIQGKGLGFLLTFLLGLIGLVISLALGDDDCKKASLITFIITTIISIVAVILYVIFVMYLIYGSGSGY